MQTRRDLYQAHKLMMQRVGLALLNGEPDVAESPMRRLSTAAFSGIMVAVLFCAIYGVWGLLSPGGARGLDKGGMVIIEKETGSKYIYDTNAKQLRPVANYASARLAIPSGKVEQRVVSRKSLAQFPRGTAIGIPGAPDSLPDPKNLVRKPWSICARTGQNSLGGTRPTTSLVAGKNVGGRPLAATAAVVVTAADQPYVIWNNQKLALKVQPTVVQNINSGNQPVPVSPAWLNAIPTGEDFADPQIPGRGTERPGPGPGGKARVGQLFQASSGQSNGGQLYVMLMDGLAPISQTQAHLLLQNPETSQAYPGGLPQQINYIAPAQANSFPSRQRILSNGLPALMPAFERWDPAEPLCVVYANPDKGDMQAQLTVGGQVTEVPAAQATSGTAADQVILPPGGAALAGLLAGPGQQDKMNTFFVVNDQGRRFGVTADAATKLGYDVKNAAPVPAAVLDLIPSGPALDPKQATTPLPLTMSGG